MKKNTFIVSKLMCDFEKQIATAFKEMNNLMAFLTLNEKFSEVSESDIKKTFDALKEDFLKKITKSL